MSPPRSTPPPVLPHLRQHDVRAWGVFVVLALLLLATVPLARPASAQLPEVPVPLPGDPEDPEDPADPEDPEDPEDPADPEDPGDPEDPADPGEGPGGGEAPGIPGAGAPAAGGPKTAYYTSATSDSLPNTLISEFPPGVVCILFPDACAEGPNQLTDPLQAGLVSATDLADASSADATQPVPPGDLPVGILGGSQRYASALDVRLPPVGENQSFGEFLVTLQMTENAFALESPAFRELVNAALVQATADAGPAAFEAFFAGIASGEVAPFTTDFPGLEMCVIKTPWDAGASQPRTSQPEIDPLFCSPVAKPGPDGAITFDMTFAANDSLPGGFVPGWEGVLVRPLAAANVAYGDPDFTTNYIAYVADPALAPPTVTAPVVDGPPPAQPVMGGTTGGDSDTGGSGGSGADVAGSTSGGGGSSSGRPASTGGSAGRPTTPSPSGSATAFGPAPVSQGAAVTSPAGVDGGTTDVAVEPSTDGTAAGPALAGVTTEVGSSAWIPWVLLPMLLGGSLWYGRVLEGGPTQAVVRAGAMTRLLRQRGFPV